MVNNWYSNNRRFILKVQHDNTVSYWSFPKCGNPDENWRAPAAQRWSTLCFMPMSDLFWSLNGLFGLTPQSKVQRTAPALPKVVSPSTASLLLTNARLYCKAVARLGQSTLLTFPGGSFFFWHVFIGHPYKMCSMTSEASLITVLDESLFGTQGGVLYSTKA